MRQTLLLAALACMCIPSALQAGVRLGIGLNFGVPYYGYGPYYRPYYGYGYGYAPAVIVGAPPVVVAPAPVYAPPPIVAAPAVPAVPAPAPAVPAPPSVIRAAAARPMDEPVDFSSLNDPSPKTRADTCIRLGRARDERAIHSLVRCLKEDDNAQVRDSAARALGLIGSTGGLDALQTAASADADHDVRRSASFAAEVIRANLMR